MLTSLPGIYSPADWETFNIINKSRAGTARTKKPVEILGKLPGRCDNNRDQRSRKPLPLSVAKGGAVHQKFIKGNEDSAEFCSGFLNYMRELSQDKNRKYLPNGSILYPFDGDYTTPLDRTKYGDSALFRIIDSTDFVQSTADLEDVADAGRSVSYDEYVARIREVEEEIAKLEMLEAVIDELESTLAVDGNIDPDLYNFIVDEVLEAQIVDEEKKNSIIHEARELADVMEDADPEEMDEDPKEMDEDPEEMNEDPEQMNEDPDQDEEDPAALEEDLDDSDIQSDEYGDETQEQDV